MKSIRLILTVLAIMSVASCGKDNGSAMPDNGNGNGTGKLVRSFIEVECEEEYYSEIAYTLLYDSSNRLADVTAVNEYGTIMRWKYSYEEGQVTVNYSVTYTDGEPDYYTCAHLFDGDKLIEDRYDDGSSLVYSYLDGSSYPTQTFFSSGELMNFSWNPSGKLMAYEGDDYRGDITYTDYKNKCNVDFIAYYMEFFANELVDVNVFKNVVFAYLPSKIVESDGYQGNFSYKFDNDGYPTEIKMTDPRHSDSYFMYKITY